DREDDAVAKAVVALAVVLDDEPAFDERPVVVALERTLERSPSVRSIADAESRGDLARQPTALEVVDGAGRLLQLGTVKVHCPFHDGLEIGLPLLTREVLADLLPAARPFLGHLKADRRGEVLDRVHVAERRIGHEKADGVAMGAAAEAVVELLRRAHGERGGLLAVKRAKAKIVGARLLELEVAGDDVDDVDAAEKVLLERIRNHAGVPGTARAAPIVIRNRSSGKPRLDEGRNLRHVGAAGEPRLEEGHRLAHVPDRARARLGERLLDRLGK